MDRIQFRRDTLDNWNRVNPILLEGEIGYVLDDPNRYKMGDGVHTWDQLHFRGFDGTIVHDTGNSENAVMSQKATSEAIHEILYDVSANNDGAVFESLQDLLSSSNLSTLIPTSARHGGMSIRFIQSSDNKYVQYRLMSDSFNTDISNWYNDYDNVSQNTQVIEQLSVDTDLISYKQLLWQFGTIDSDGSIATGGLGVYRNITTNIIHLTSPLTISIASGYRYLLAYYKDDGTYISKDSNWRTSECTISGTNIRITVAKNTDATPSSSTEWASKLTLEGSSIQMLLNYTKTSIYSINNVGGQIGYIASDHISINPNLQKARIAYGFIPANSGTKVSVTEAANYEITGLIVEQFDNNGNFIANIGDFNSTNELTVAYDGFIIVYVLTTLSDATDYIQDASKHIFVSFNNQNKEKQITSNLIPLTVEFEYGSINANGLPEGSNTARIRTKNAIPVGKGTLINVKSFHEIAYLYLYDENGVMISNSGAFLYSAIIEIPTNCYFKLVIKKQNDAAFSQDELTNYTIDGDIKPMFELIGLPSYYHTDNYIENKVAAIREHDEDCGFQGDAFIFVTDEHLGFKRTQQLASYIRDNTSAKRLVLNGDYYNNENTKNLAKNDFFKVRKAFDFYGDKYLPIIGNHEWNNPGATPGASYQLDAGEVYAMVYKENETIFNIIDELSYYWDNTTQQIRYFVLGCNLSGEIPATTKDLFIASLNNTPNGWAIVVLSHVGLNSDDTIRTSFIPIIEALENIISDGNNDVIGCFTGDRHKDGIIISTGGVVICSTTTSGGVELGGLTRTLGTVNESAFDIVQIDKTNKKVYLTRIGAGSDRTFDY